MRVVPTEIPDVLLVYPDLHRDYRGYFLETFRDSRYAEAGIAGPFVQDNVSSSKEGTLRGLHFQNPRPQAKLVSVLNGTIFDVAVDVRIGSPTFRQWVGMELSDKEHAQLWVPEGFAHGFLVLSSTAVVQYKCRGDYVPGCEHTLIWNDPSLAIEWPRAPALISPKDQAGKTLETLQAEALLPG